MQMTLSQVYEQMYAVKILLTLKILYHI